MLTHYPRQYEFINESPINSQVVSTFLCKNKRHLEQIIFLDKYITIKRYMFTKINLAISIPFEDRFLCTP